MASEPIPEPLTNQEVKSEKEPNFPASSRRGPELVSRAAPPIPGKRELPRAPRQQEWKGAVQDKFDSVKEAASRAKDTASQAVQEVKQQAAAAVSQTKGRAADVYRESRDKAADTVNRARVQTHYVLDRYPLQVIAGIAAIAFVAGVALRIWRSSRDA